MKSSLINYSLLLLLVFISLPNLHANMQQEIEDYNQYSGTVVDNKTGNPLVFASLVVDGTNISTITNTDGEFLLKVSADLTDVSITVNFLGYHKKVIPLVSLKKVKNRIRLNMAIINLSEVVVTVPKDAKSLVRATFKKKGENNLNKHLKMTAFYRETIKKRKRNVSLSEAIVSIYKQPYTNSRRDNIKLLKARKSTDYTRLDTIAVKLQGGPFNALYVDLMKYPQYLFTEDSFDLYTYSFAPSTTINDRSVFVVNFKQHHYIKEPLYYGKLFIDAESLALTSALFHLNVSNKALASKLFVKKKPKDVTVQPQAVAYRVDYIAKDGKWYYSYSNAQLTFKIDKKKKWFDSTFSLTSEMAVTDWSIIDKKEGLKYAERMSPSIIISDKASGFSDSSFWGAYNVIEPEKSIESAIKKIKRQLSKLNKS